MKSNICSKWMRYLGIIYTVLIFLLAPMETTSAAGQSVSQQKLTALRNHARFAKNKSKSLSPKSVSSFAQLKGLLKAKAVRPFQESILGAMNSPRVNLASTAVAADTAGKPSYSETNVQVAGVDEGDIVKTDGQYIYKIDAGVVRIIQAYPADHMVSLATLTFQNSFYPSQLYIHGEQLIVLGSAWRSENTGEQTSNMLARMAIWGYVSGESQTFARIYNMADHENPQLQREVVLAGDYVSSRLIGERFYLISRNYPNYFSYIMGFQAETAPTNVMTRDNTLPHIKDSVVNSGAEFTLSLNNLFYFPNFVDPNYTLVAGLRMDDLTQKADIKAYLGSGDTIYASNKNLYISAADYSNLNNSVPKTHFYKFALDNGNLSFLKAGEVPGTVLNSFSMDEHNGYFRVATTVNQWLQTGDVWNSNTWNNLYTLDGDMQIAGRMEHLAKDERIYSVRFMGDRCYLVTFRQTDPFFVIDLSTPNTPKVLGELKIPGFSFYLHPYDENHVIGFGQDTEENSWGGVNSKGLKLSLFDVTHVEHPAQLHSLIIGDQGTYSPLQWDHKALFFDKQRNLLGFPIYEVRVNSYGQYEWFQGAQVFSIGVDDGFKKLGAVTQQRDEGYQNWNWDIQRLLTIEDQLYTFSEPRIQANDLTSFKQTGFLDFPREEPEGCYFFEGMTLKNADLAISCQVVPFVDHQVSEPAANTLETPDDANGGHYH